MEVRFPWCRHVCETSLTCLQGIGIKKLCRIAESCFAPQGCAKRAGEAFLLPCKRSAIITYRF